MELWQIVLVFALSLPAGLVLHRLVERGPTELPFLAPLRLGHPSGQQILEQCVLTVGFVALGYRFIDASLGVIIGMFAFCTVLVALAAIDLATYRLPDRIVLPMLCGSIVWVTAASLISGHPDQIRFALTGSLVYFGMLLLAHLVSPRGMGFGDVKLAALLGLFLGWVGGSALDAVVLVLWAMIIGFATGTVSGLAILVRRRSNRPFPFGPFLAIGTMIALLASARICGS
jgi:leader peptidase (prepilin peptidase) / N-methyltransferase